MTTEREIDLNQEPDRFDNLYATFIPDIKVTDSDRFVAILKDSCASLTEALPYLLAAAETKILVGDQAITGQQLAHELISRIMAGELVGRIPVSHARPYDHDLVGLVVKKVQNLAAATTQEEARELVKRYQLIVFPGLPFDIQFQLLGFFRLPQEQKTLAEIVNSLEKATQELDALGYQEMVKKGDPNLRESHENLLNLLREMETVAPLYTQLIKDSYTFQHQLGNRITRRYGFLQSCFPELMPIFESVKALVTGEFQSLAELKELLRKSGPITLGRKLEGKGINLGLECSYLLLALEKQEEHIRQNFPFEATAEEQETFLDTSLRFFSKAIGDLNKSNRFNLRARVKELIRTELGLPSIVVADQVPAEQTPSQD